MLFQLCRQLFNDIQVKQWNGSCVCVDSVIVECSKCSTVYNVGLLWGSIGHVICFACKLDVFVAISSEW